MEGLVEPSLGAISTHAWVVELLLSLAGLRPAPRNSVPPADARKPLLGRLPAAGHQRHAHHRHSARSRPYLSLAASGTGEARGGRSIGPQLSENY